MASLSPGIRKMPRTSTNTSLPEPKHPFARWFGFASVGVWAIVTQNFVEPWNKIAALASPGIGYILGYGLEGIINLFSEALSTRKKQTQLRDAEKRLQALLRERRSAIENGADSCVLKMIEVHITNAHQEKVHIISL
jgi:hypothetical protein